MSNHLTGPGGNSTSSVKSFFKDVGSATVNFGKHLIICVESFYRYSIGKVVDYFSEESKLLRERKASDKNDNFKFENQLVLNKKTFEYKYNKFKDHLISFITNDTIRHVTKFLLFAAGTALLIPGMLSIPGAIVAFTILGIAVTRFIFKAVHIIKQASNNYFVGNRINTIVKTIFRLLIAAAEIPAFFFGGPLASLITQPISGAILGIMKAYDDIKINERIKKELDQLDPSKILDEEDVDDEEDSEIDEDEGEDEISQGDDNSD